MTMNPNVQNHEWFEELCALAAIGELSSSEHSELQSHLAECQSCRALHEDCLRIAVDGMGYVFGRQQREEGAVEPLAGADDFEKLLDENALLGALRQRLERERGNALLARAVTSVNHPPQTTHRFLTLWNFIAKPVPAYLALAMVALLAWVLIDFHSKELRQASDTANLLKEVAVWQGQAEKLKIEDRQSAENLTAESQSEKQAQSENEALRKSLQEARVRYQGLVLQQKNLEQQLAGAQAHSAQLQSQLEAANSATVQGRAQKESLEARLDNVNTILRQQRNEITDLSARLEGAEETLKSAKNQVGPDVGDLEAKGLFGARDLHIVDVYDVDGTGKAKRTYGRVYYVEKKLLVFYAFDLQDKRRNRVASAFQAWGYREATDRKPENLGLFFVDDASLNRWALKVNNPKVLEHIDAVFVTLEPPAGSSEPRGRRLLYANLTGAPNHP